MEHHVFGGATALDRISVRYLVPYIITSGPASAWTLLGCGRWRGSYIRHPTPRKSRYYQQHIRRHEKGCSGCKNALKAWRARNISFVTHPELVTDSREKALA